MVSSFQASQPVKQCTDSLIQSTHPHSASLWYIKKKLLRGFRPNFDIPFSFLRAILLPQICLMTWDLNPGLPNIKQGVLTTRLWCSVNRSNNAMYWRVNFISRGWRTKTRGRKERRALLCGLLFPVMWLREMKDTLSVEWCSISDKIHRHAPDFLA
jgi:hypothetical protein